MGPEQLSWAPKHPARLRGASWQLDSIACLRISLPVWPCCGGQTAGALGCGRRLGCFRADFAMYKLACALDLTRAGCGLATQQCCASCAAACRSCRAQSRRAGCRQVRQKDLLVPCPLPRANPAWVPPG